MVVPSTVFGWFTLLHTDLLLGLTALTALQILDVVLIIPTLLALYFARRQINPSLMTIAVTLGLVGITVYLATNTTFALLAVNNKYTGATTASQRAMLLAAGQALLTLYQSTGVIVRVFLLSVAVLLISVVMLRSIRFGTVTAAVGLLAGASGLVYESSIAVPVIPNPYQLLLLSVLWIVLGGLRLFGLDRAARSYFSDAYASQAQ